MDIFGIDYRPVEDLFPDWPEAKEKLTLLCEYTKGWTIAVRESNLIMALDIPCIQDGDKRVRAIDCYPKKESAQVEAILLRLCKDYLPDDVEKLRGRFDEKKLIDEAAIIIEQRERAIVAKGGLPILNEMRRRFGIPFLTGTAKED